MPTSLRRLSAALLDRRQPSAWYVMGSAAVVVGLLAGAGIWLFEELFHLAIEGAARLTALAGGGWAAAGVTALAGLLVGLVRVYWVGPERHHGVAGIIESVALAGGRLRYWRMPAKLLAAVLSIGGGASVGPEDPSVQLGANAGSMVGQALRLSDERTRVLVAAGAASGVAAAFNAPIAGVFFALEIILGEIAGSALGVVLLAAVVSAAFTQAVSGPQPAFAVPVYPYRSPVELPFYLGLGLLAGPVAAFYSRLIYAVQDTFHAWRAPEWLKPACAGLIVGLCGLFVPQVQGVGYDTIGAILNHTLAAAGLLALLFVAKLLLTPLSVGGGFVGGIFAPALFIGAALGGAYGILLDRLLPGLDVAPAAYAMVGMAAVLAGTIHGPLTAVLLLFEMTNDYRIILPLMAAVTVSLFLSQRIQRDSVYLLALARKGIRIERGRDVEVLAAITVGEVMDTDFGTLPEEMALADAAAVLMARRSHGLPVVNPAGKLAGVLTVRDIEAAQAAAGDRELTVRDACTRDVLTAYADETMGAALRRMAPRDIGRLPVVADDDPTRIIGVLRRTNVIRAYDAALTRRAILRHRAQQVRLGEVGRVGIHELTIRPGAACDGKRVGEIAWPHDCVIATLRRGAQVTIPRGDTLLQAGDVLAVVAEDAALATVRSVCQEGT